jgi:2'-5' RNA ligase
MAQEIGGPDDEFCLMIKVGEPGQSAAVQAALGALAPDCARMVRQPDIIHATVLHLDKVAEDRAISVANALAPYVRLSPFSLVFDRCEWRPHPSCAPNGIAILHASRVPPEWAVLRRLASEIPRRLKKPKKGGDSPHLTVAYHCPPFEGVDLAVPVVWQVTEFQLIRILMGQKTHRELGRWALS